jgi:hypothetical protein
MGDRPSSILTSMMAFLVMVLHNMSSWKELKLETAPQCKMHLKVHATSVPTEIHMYPHYSNPVPVPVPLLLPITSYNNLL